MARNGTVRLLFGQRVDQLRERRELLRLHQVELLHEKDEVLWAHTIQSSGQHAGRSTDEVGQGKDTDKGGGRTREKASEVLAQVPRAGLDRRQ